MFKPNGIFIIGAVFLAISSNVTGDATTAVFSDYDKRDLIIGNVLSSIGTKVSCLAQHCNIDWIYDIIKLCVERSRALPRDEMRTTDQNMDSLLQKLILTDYEAGLQNSLCEKIPYPCAHNYYCDVPGEIRQMINYYTLYGALVECLYETHNHAIIEASKSISVNGFIEVVLSSDGPDTSVGIVNNVMTKVVAQQQKLDNGRCKNVISTQDNCV